MIINAIYKNLVSREARKQKFDQRNCIFQKLQFPLRISFDETIMTKLAVDNKEAAILVYRAIVYFRR